MEAFVIDPSQIIREIIGCITDLRSVNHASQQPISDDETTLHKFCVKLETLLRHEQRERYSLLGIRKDYWNFIAECIPKDDGIKYVHAIPQMKTPQGKGRAFIRYALVQKTLADTIQRCLVSTKRVRDWYRRDAILQNRSLCTALINKLYDLNDVDFELSCAGHDLDISWPAFSRRAFGEGLPSGRRSSVTSLTSTDFRNERADPLVGLAAEVTSLKDVFSHESSLAKFEESGEIFDNISITDSTMEQPCVADLTLSVSHVHQQLLKWKGDMESRLEKSQRDTKKASDEIQYANRESELKIKQLHEKFTNLTRFASAESSARTKALSETLKDAEESLKERDAEISKLRQEVNKYVESFHDSEKSMIEIERRLASSEREVDEQVHRKQKVEEKLAVREQALHDLRAEVERKQGTIDDLQEKAELLKEQLSEVKGDFKAKEVALERVQESFEKLNGMVFGSFEELESELKGRLLDKDKGLQNQSAENHRLELSMVDVQQENRQVRKQLADANLSIQALQSSNRKSQESVNDMEIEAKKNGQKLKDFEDFTAQLWDLLQPHAKCGNPGKQEENASIVLQFLQDLLNEASVAQQSLIAQQDELQNLGQHVSELEAENQEKDSDITRLKEGINASRNELQQTIQQKNQLENDKLETMNKLTELEEREESLLSDLSVITKEKVKSETELCVVNEQQMEEKESRESTEAQLTRMKQQLQEKSDSKQELVQELTAMTESLRALDVETSTQLATLELQNVSLQDDKSTLESEIEVARQQLEAANEARIRAEQGHMRAQDQLESVQCMMDQEVAALKFQLSSETMKYETELKVLSAESRESVALRDRVSEQEEIITDLEARVKERNDAWQNDRHKHINEIKHLKSEIQIHKGTLDTNKQRMVSLENEFLLATKQLETEKARQKELKRKMEQTVAQKALSEEKCDQKMAQTNQDMAEVKRRLVELTHDKADLWKKADDMEHEIKLKATDRWIDDDEVKHCSACRAEFSFLVRRHHCRSCGRIFCYSCVNNWIKTPHSRKLKRVCNPCFVDSDRKLRSESVQDHRGTDNDDSMSDISSLDSSRHRESLLGLDDGGPFTSPAQYDGESSGAAQSSSSHMAKAANNGKFTEENQAKSRTNTNSTLDSNDSSDDQYTSLTSVETGSRQVKLDRAESVNTEDKFEFVDFDDADVQPEVRVVIYETDMRAGVMIPPINDGQGEFREVAVSAGKRYVLPVLMGTPGTTLCWKFSTSKKSMVFGVAYKASESTSDEEIQTRLPLAQYASHLHMAKGQLKADKPGYFLLVFDNTYPRSVTERVFYVVHAKRQTSRGIESELQ